MQRESEKQGTEAALQGSSPPNHLPSRRKRTRIPVDRAVMTATEAAGIFNAVSSIDKAGGKGVQRQGGNEQKKLGKGGIHG